MGSSIREFKKWNMRNKRIEITLVNHIYIRLISSNLNQSKNLSKHFFCTAEGTLYICQVTQNLIVCSRGDTLMCQDEL